MLNTKKLILYSDRKHFKLQLGIKDNGLQVKEKLLRTEMDSAEIPTRCSFVIEFIIPKFIEHVSSGTPLIIGADEAPDDERCAARNMLRLQ